MTRSRHDPLSLTRAAEAALTAQIDRLVGRADRLRLARRALRRAIDRLEDRPPGPRPDRIDLPALGEIVRQWLAARVAFSDGVWTETRVLWGDFRGWRPELAAVELRHFSQALALLCPEQRRYHNLTRRSGFLRLQLIPARETADA